MTLYVYNNLHFRTYFISVERPCFSLTIYIFGKVFLWRPTITYLFCFDQFVPGLSFFYKINYIYIPILYGPTGREVMFYYNNLCWHTYLYEPTVGANMFLYSDLH